MRPYEKDPKAIYAESFATVAREADLTRFPHGLDKLATRVIHACGMVEVADRLAFSEQAFRKGAAALAAGAPILCDCEMVGAGIIRRYLPAENPVIVTLNDPSVPALAQAIGNTRSAAAVELWAAHLEGAVVAANARCVVVGYWHGLRFGGRGVDARRPLTRGPSALSRGRTAARWPAKMRWPLARPSCK